MALVRGSCAAGWQLDDLRVESTPPSGLVQTLTRFAGGRDVRAVAVAAAGRIRAMGSEREVVLTNTGLRVRQTALAEMCGGPALLVNDLEAVAASLPALTGRDCESLGGTPAGAPARRIVVGVGTGLGAALLDDDGRIIGTEAGHADLPAVSLEEREVVASFGEQRMSVEALLSGPGLARLHSALHRAPPTSVPDLLASAGRGDPAALQTFALFSRWLGRVAGNLVLSTGAWGGVYLAGGVVSGLAQWLDTVALRAGFEDKEPFSSVLAGVPMLRIIHPQPALIGLARLASAEPGIGPDNDA